MSTLCNYKGPTTQWNLSLDGFGNTSTFFPAVAGCCNLVAETNFPNKPFTFLHLLFEQLGKNGTIISSYLRTTQKAQTYTGLENTQITLRSETSAPIQERLTGIQKYINCSDANNLVQDPPPKKLDPGIIIASVVGSIIGLTGIVSCGVYCYRNENSYGRF